eukprot:gene19358-955_t
MRTCSHTDLFPILFIHHTYVRRLYPILAETLDQDPHLLMELKRGITDVDKITEMHVVDTIEDIVSRSKCIAQRLMEGNLGI